MSDRDASLSRPDLCARAEILGRMADQLARQLEVERRANEELRALLGEASPSPIPCSRRRARSLPFLIAALGGIVLAASVSAIMLRPRPVPAVYALPFPEPSTPPLAAAMLQPMAIPPVPSPLVPQSPPWRIPVKDQARPDPVTTIAPDASVAAVLRSVREARPDPVTTVAPEAPPDRLLAAEDGRTRACMPITTPARARCYLDATRGVVSGTGERGLRNHVLAYFLLGERERARALARRYRARFPDSPYARQMSLLAY